MLAIDYLGAIVAAVAQFKRPAVSMNAAAKNYATQDAKNRAHPDRADGRTLAIYAARQFGQLSRGYGRHGIAPDISAV